jgi:hypothetical protein
MYNDIKRLDAMVRIRNRNETAGYWYDVRKGGSVSWCNDPKSLPKEGRPYRRRRDPSGIGETLPAVLEM